MSEDDVSRASDYSPARPVAYSRPADRPAGAAHTLGAVTLLKAASTVSLLTLASRVTGLVRDLLMASAFGVSGLTDALAARRQARVLLFWFSGCH